MNYSYILFFRYRPCYNSCAHMSSSGDCGYLDGSCDWTSCHDDLAFTETVLYDILNTFCVDADSIHVTGVNNGGMFVWSNIMKSLSATFASAGQRLLALLHYFPLLLQGQLPVLQPEASTRCPTPPSAS